MKRQITDPFHAISDPSRRQILMLLSNDGMSINALASQFEMSRPAISKHVKVLHASGFITIANIGRERMCLLKPEGFKQLQDWISYFDGFWKIRLQKLEELMAKKASTSPE